MSDADKKIQEAVGLLSKQGARRAMAIGVISGFMGPVLNRWEPAMIIGGIIIGEEASVGDTILPTPAIEKSPMMALAGLVLGIVTGVVFKEVQKNGYI